MKLPIEKSEAFDAEVENFVDNKLRTITGLSRLALTESKSRALVACP